MKSDTDLDLVFKNAVGKKVILNIEEPKATVTKSEIDAAMQVIVANNILISTAKMSIPSGCLVGGGTNVLK